MEIYSNRDKNVKVFKDGVAVSPLGKPLNFINDFNTTINPAGYYDIALKVAGGKVLDKLNGATVGSGVPRTTNFINDFNMVETPATDSYDVSLKYPGKVLSNANLTTPRILNFVSGVNAFENVGNNTLDITASGPSPVTGKKWGTFMGGSNANSGTGKGGTGFFNNWNQTGTMTPGGDNDGMYMNFTTGTTSGNLVSYKGDVNTGYLFPLHNPVFWIKFKLSSVTNIRMYIGFYDVDPLPTNTLEYLNSNKGFGIMYDSSFTNYQLEWNNSLATNSRTDLGLAPSVGGLVTVKLFPDTANSRWGISLNGANPAYILSNIPQLSAWSYGFIINFQTMTSSSKNLFVYYLYAEADK